MELFEKELKRKYIYEGKILKLRHDLVELPDGKVADREIIEHSGGSGVLAVTENDEIISVTGYHYNTTANDFIVSENTTGITSRRTFTHRIFTQQNQNLAVVTVTVNGSISADNTEISHVSASLSDEQMDSLNISQHISGQTATVVLYVNQISVCHFQYRLLSDGDIELL